MRSIKKLLRQLLHIKTSDLDDKMTIFKCYIRRFWLHAIQQDGTTNLTAEWMSFIVKNPDGMPLDISDSEPA